MKYNPPICLVVAFSIFTHGSHADESVSFEKQILPILEAKCFDCHQKEREVNGRVKKPKHGLRVDHVAGIEKGGKEYPSAFVVAGKPDESWFLKVLDLPEDDDLFMPPKGKADAVTDAEKELIKKWIASGAEFGGWKGTD